MSKVNLNEQAQEILEIAEKHGDHGNSQAGNGKSVAERNEPYKLFESNGTDHQRNR